MSLDKKYDAIVVGGGHNGLVAATYLAKAGKKVVLLEAEKELGGATTSVKPFPEFEARLSRYSYLVSLLPDQIVSDLGINFRTLERSIASYTPNSKAGQDGGLLISQNWDDRTAQNFREVSGSDAEGEAWQKFYGEIAVLAERIAPSMLQPLKTAKQLSDEIGLSDTWKYLMERPIGEVIRERFNDDIVRGVVLTDALIGTFSSSDDLQANRCFLYHLIGNGTGQWRVPQGGMGALVLELKRVAIEAGVEILLNSRVAKIDSDAAGVSVTTETNEKFSAQNLLFAGAPQTLAKIRGIAAPTSLDGSQMKMNMLLTKLPRLKSGVDPRLAFAGTFHVNESFSQLETAYRSASAGSIPKDLPLEMYCHTLTDPTILSPELAESGYQTLTLFGLHTPAELFEKDNNAAKKMAQKRCLDALNDYLLDPIESVLAVNSDGSLCIEVKSPLDLETDVRLPGGNIFHRDLNFPFKEEGDSRIWGVETDDPRIFICGAGAQRGGGVSGIPGHNAAMALLLKG